MRDKIKDIIDFIYLSLFGDKKKILFMQELMNICDTNKDYEYYVKILSDGNTKYLEELYEYWIIHGDIQNKLEFDRNSYLINK